tara:strand:- start:4076 stop:8911 length:4836 start_codon:yes stop_codon:yes gene_type:complete
MSVLDISYSIILDDTKKTSYKRLRVSYKNNNIVQDISSIFVIKPSKRFNNYLKNTDISFNEYDNIEYDLSFSNVSFIEFSDISKNLVPGRWSFGYKKSYTPSTTDLSGIKTVFIPYRDFLYDNEKPIMIRDETNRNKLFLTINNEELLNFRNNNKYNFYSLGKNNTIDTSGNTYLSTYLEFINWFPEDEISINTTKSNAWSLPTNFLGSNDDNRIDSCPTYHTNENNEITLYENLSTFNEPGFRYDNASIVGKTFFVNKVARFKINTNEYNNIYSQYYKIQQADTSYNFTTTTTNFIKIDGTSNIDNWEADIFISKDTILKTKTGVDPSGVFSYSTNDISTNGLLLGIRGNGKGSNSYIFRDIDGKAYQADLSKYGVARNDANSFKGGFSIRYKIRKNTNNKHDVYIFINDNFVTKVDNSGCKLEDIKYWGLPSDSSTTGMIKSITRVFESIPTQSYFNDVYQDISNVNWDVSTNYVDVSNNLLERILDSATTNSVFSQTKGLIVYPVIFKNNKNNSSDASCNYTFDSGKDNVVNLQIVDLSFNPTERLYIYLSNDTTNWIPFSPESIGLSDQSNYKGTIHTTNYRYVKFIFKKITSPSSEWEIRIFIREYRGYNEGILPNYNNINIDCSDNQIESICYELDSSTINKTTFENSIKFSKNNNQIPYISRYDYIMRDICNNIVLKSQIDKDILYTIDNSNYNYNSKRTMKELALLPITLNSMFDAYTIRQKYNYNSKLLNDVGDYSLPYIPGKAELTFINSNSNAVITIPNSQISSLKDNLINFWGGKNYPTYVEFILYIWYPWSDKITNYTTTEAQASIDLSYNLTENGSDEIIKINISDKTFYTLNKVGIPISNSFNYLITEFSGRYIFSWSYRVFQPNGIYNNKTPFDVLYLTNETYNPQINILNVKDFVKDDFIYDPQTPEMKYYAAVQNISTNKITVSLSSTEIINFNKNILKHRRSLTSQNCDISAVELNFYVWTPNNEKNTNPYGWELPSDYYGIGDERLLTTPYRFSNLPLGVSNINYDPKYILNGITQFGYNTDASGTIVKKFDIIPTSGEFFIGDISGTQKMEFDISQGIIFFHPNDTNKTTFETNKSIPSPYKYSKNSIFGVPYLSRWGFKIYEDYSFQTLGTANTGTVLIKTISATDISYGTINSETYPVLFTDNGGIENNYSNNFEGVQVFDAGIGNTISLLVEYFEFNHEFTTNATNFKDRLAILGSDLSGSDMSFNPIQVKWMQRTGISNELIPAAGDICGNIWGGDGSGNNYHTDNNGFVFPKDKITAVRNYKDNTTETNPKDFENLSLNKIRTKKRYVKFRFYSDGSVTSSGWKIRILKSPKESIKKIESRVILQKGNIGNESTDFNFNFKLNPDYYLELSKTIKTDNPNLLDLKDLSGIGITLGFQKQKPFFIIKMNDVLWQFVIKKPPAGYIFDHLDENGNVLGQLPPVSDKILTTDNIDLTATNIGNIVDTTLKFDGTTLSFDEDDSSTSLDNERKYILYIRKSTSKEKTFLNNFATNKIIQFENEDIRTRLSDWYPMNINYESSNNKYNYKTLFDTEDIVAADVVVEKIVDPCGKCRTITKTKNSKNFNLRYAEKVKIGFSNAGRLKESCS